MELDNIGIFFEGRRISTVIFDSSPDSSRLMDALSPYRKVYVVVDGLAMEKSRPIEIIVQRLDSEGFPILIADDGGTFCRAIAHGEVEANFVEEHFNLAVESSAADDDFVEVATEGFSQFLTYLLAYARVDDGQA